MGEGFTCIWYYDLARRVHALLKGETPPPVRQLGGYGRWKIFWDRIYSYHKTNNYPILYKHDTCYRSENH